MSFSVWVRTHVHYQRAPRLQAIYTLLAAVGPLLAHDVRVRLARAGEGHIVTIDTLRRDLKLLEIEGYLRRVDLGDPYELRYTLATDAL